MKRYALILALSVFAALPASAAVTLKYWCATNPEEITLATELVAVWNASHPDIQVNLSPIPAGQSSEEVLLAAIAAGTTPDLCSNIWPGVLPEYIDAKGLMDLGRFPDAEAFLAERIPPDLLTTFRYKDGHFYQVPWKANPILIYYNKKLFREAGLTSEPRTYSEYMNTARRLTIDRDGDGQPDQWMTDRSVLPVWWQRFFDFYPFYIAASGGRTYFKKGELSVDAMAAVQAFALFRECYRTGVFPKSTIPGEPFINGRLGTTIAGPWYLSHIKNTAPPGFEFGVMDIPLPDGNSGPTYTYGDFKNISIFNTCKHPDAAWTFAKYLVSPHSDLRLLEITNQIPIRKNLSTDPLYHDFFAANPNVVKFAERVPNSRGVDDVENLKEIFDAVSQEYEACAVYGARSPAAAAANILRRVKVIVDWNRE